MHLTTTTRHLLRGAAVVAVAVMTATALPAGPAGAALGDHIWSRGFPTGGFVGIDGTDQYVTHGGFFGTIDLGGGPMTAVNFLDGDQYLARFDASGNHIWSMQITPVGAGASNELLAVDAAGNSYITGYVFINTDIDFGGGPITGPQMYIAKFDANGVHQWSAGYGDARPYAIAANGSHVVVTGFTSTGVDFGGGTVGTAGQEDIFVAQLTSAGAHAWSAGYGDTDRQAGMGCTIDGSGNVLVVGSMFGTVDFGGGGLTAILQDLFIAKFSSTGVHTWSKVVDGLFKQGGGVLLDVSVATGPSDEVAVSGQIENSVDFGGGAISSNGFGDAYLVKYDAAGIHQWSAGYGSTNGTDFGTDVAIDGSGNVLMTARIVGDADFGGGTLTHFGGLFDGNIVVALYNPSGTHLFSNNYGPSGFPSGDFDSTDQMVIWGSGGISIDMGGGAISPASLFIAKLEGANGPPTAIGDLPVSNAPALSALPNPFNPVTTIRYEITTPGQVSLSVYDVRGRLVENTVAERWHAAGRHTANFVARASGVYFVTLRDGVSVRTIKTVAIK